MTCPNQAASINQDIRSQTTRSILTSHHHHGLPCHGDNKVLQSFRPISGSLESDWPETVFEALLTSTRPPPLHLTRANPHRCSHRGCLVVTPMVPSAYMILRLGPSFLSLAYSPFVATRLFIKRTDPFTACLVTFVFVTSLGCTLDFLFAFSKTNHIVPFSTFDILAPRFALVYQALR